VPLHLRYHIDSSHIEVIKVNLLINIWKVSIICDFIVILYSIEYIVDFVDVLAGYIDHLLVSLVCTLRSHHHVNSFSHFFLLWLLVFCNRTNLRLRNRADLSYQLHLISEHFVVYRAHQTKLLVEHRFAALTKRKVIVDFLLLTRFKQKINR